MNLSGIVVATRPEHVDLVRKPLETIAGIDIFQVEAKSGGIIVVQEAINADQIKGGIPMDKEHYSAQGEISSTQGWRLFEARGRVVYIAALKVYLPITARRQAKAQAEAVKTRQLQRQVRGSYDIFLNL